MLIHFVGNIATPGLIIGAIMYAPLLNRIRNEIAAMGMEPERLYKAVKRFKELGDRGRVHQARADVSVPASVHAGVVTNPRHPYHCWPTRWSGCPTSYPRALLPAVPTWFKELTHEPAA